MKRLISFSIFFLIFQSCSNEVGDKTKSKNELDYISISKTGNLIYHEDEKGNKIPDFSYVGYHSGEKPSPEIPTLITLEALPKDNTKNIQTAIDKLGQLTKDKNGFRGAILLKKGIVTVQSLLRRILAQIEI